MDNKVLKKICIFCKKDSSESKSKEHIVPESMGCPEGLYLSPGIVCDKCNNNILARLDSDLQDCFGILKPWFIAQNKKGKPITVKNKYYYAENNNGHFSIFINKKGKPVEVKKGIFLKSIEDNKKVIHSFEEKICGKETNVKFSQNFILNDNSKRALHKIAFEFYCWMHGEDVVLDKKFDIVRDYILFGKGKRSILMGEKYRFGDLEGIHQFHSTAQDEKGNIIVPFLLFDISFVVSLVGSMEKLQEMKDKAQELSLPKFIAV